LHQLIEQLQKFNDELNTLVQTCPEETWQRACHPEEWPVSVVVRHVAAGHYSIIETARRLIEGKPLAGIKRVIAGQQDTSIPS
jgi:hypothetical protein